jgi:hypothetical protein
VTALLRSCSIRFQLRGSALVMIGVDADGADGGAGDSENVTQAFQPSGL